MKKEIKDLSLFDSVNTLQLKDDVLENMKINCIETILDLIMKGDRCLSFLSRDAFLYLKDLGFCFENGYNNNKEFYKFLLELIANSNEKVARSRAFTTLKREYGRLYSEIELDRKRFDEKITAFNACIETIDKHERLKSQKTIETKRAEELDAAITAILSKQSVVKKRGKK